jgi:hypothetical protein
MNLYKGATRELQVFTLVTSRYGKEHHVFGREKKSFTHHGKSMEAQ